MTKPMCIPDSSACLFRRLFRIAAAALLGLGLLACAAAPDPGQELEDNRLLELALEQPSSDGRFEVVFPDTSLLLQDRSRAAMDSIRDRIRGFVKSEGFDARALLDRFLSRNKRSRRLTLQSSEMHGFFVDYDKKFYPYFQGNEGDWKRMYASFPKVTGVKHVSLPVRDPVHAVVLLYICRQTLPAGGSGHIFVYRDTGGALQELGVIQTWVP